MTSGDGGLTSSVLMFEIDTGIDKIAYIQNVTYWNELQNHLQQSKVEGTSDTNKSGRTLKWKRSLSILLQPHTSFEAKLLQDVRAFQASILKEEGQADAVVLATRLVGVGYRVAVRTALGGGTGQECFHNLHYVFLLVTDGDSLTEYIVDPHFREQFLISQSTREYQEILSWLPKEYVGTAARLTPLVKLLCSEMQHAFQVVGLTCPPWRRENSMLSKWVPSRVEDTEVEKSFSSSDRGKSLAGCSPRGPLSRCNSSLTSSSSLSSQTYILRLNSLQAFQPLVRRAGFTPSALNSNAVNKDVGVIAVPDCSSSTASPWPNSSGYSSKENSRPFSSSPPDHGIAGKHKTVKDTQQVGRQNPMTWEAPPIRTVKLSREKPKS